MEKLMFNKQNTLVIAEAGVNHNGNFDMAIALIDVAADAGANIIKFQTFDAKALTNKFASKANYQQKTTNTTKSQLEMLQTLELPHAWHQKLIAQCKSRNITFLSTPFDFPSINFLASLDMKIWKIPSGEITNLPYLREIGKRGEEVILSTGMSTLEEVATALQILEACGTIHKNISILHCTTEYPAPYDEINLRAMQTLRKAFPYCKGIGYSDHSRGIEISLAAVALGAIFVDKHFTLDKNLEGPYHKASLDPHELKQMVQSIRNIENAMGDGVKSPTASEIPNMSVARKSIVAAKNIKVGEVFSIDNLTIKRPGDGISPMLWDAVLGTVATQDYLEDMPIKELVNNAT